MAGFTPLQKKVLDLLTRRVRVIEESQLVRAWQLGSLSLRRALKALEARHLISLGKAATRLPIAARTIAMWEPGDLPPDFVRMAWMLERRYYESPVKPRWIAWARKRAARLTGGIGGSIRQPLQLSHDLGVASMFLNRVASTSQNWVSEDLFRREFRRTSFLQKVPDAVLVNEDAKIVLAIEYGGKYSSERLSQFHADCQRARIPYEIW